MPRSYPPEFRRKVLDLLKAGRKVAEIAHDLQISEQTIYAWRQQEQVDAGQVPGLTSVEKAELAAARRRIAELETELAVHQRASELLTEAVRPKARFVAIATMAEEGLPIQMACRILGVSESGFHAWRGRLVSARSVRHVWLTDLIQQVHAASRGVDGARRVHAELSLGRGITVSHGAVEMRARRTAENSALRTFPMRAARPVQYAGVPSWPGFLCGQADDDAEHQYLALPGRQDVQQFA